MYPSTLALTKEEESNVCFLAFPDSHSNSTGDTMFSFRIPRLSSAGGAVSASVDPIHLNGYVFNRVQRDKSQKRGYLQKSVVLLTERSDVLLWPLFRHAVRLLGPEYFRCEADHVMALLEAAFRETCAWPAPRAGVRMEVPLLGTVVRYNIAGDEMSGVGYEAALGAMFYAEEVGERRGQQQQQQQQGVTVLNAVDELSVYETMRVLLPDMWTMWEMVLIGEPLLVVAHTPDQASAAVTALVSLILPLRYAGEWRPYFTIHDSDYKRVAHGPPARATILGVTNPFFLREFKDWPHKLLMAPDVEANLRLPQLSQSAPSWGTSSSSPSLSSSSLRQGHDETVLQTKYKCLISPGRTLLDELIPLKGTKPGFAGEANWRDINGTIAKSNNRAIRRHFFERTQKFLAPLESYFTSLMPIVPSSQSANGSAGLPDADRLIKCFDKAEFLRRVAEQPSAFGSGLFEVKKRVELYRRFVNSRTFDLWYFEKMKRTIDHLQKKP